MYVTLAEAKKHLNIDADFKLDDNYIQQLISVAELVAEKQLNCSLLEMEVADGELPSPLTQAMLLHIGTMYRNREATAEKAFKECEMSYSFLLSNYRKYSV